MSSTWKAVNQAYFELSEEGKKKVRDSAIACLLHLPERCPEPKIYNVPCPNPICDGLLAVRETDLEQALCTCRNYNLWVAWREDKPIVGLVSPVVHEEEL